MCVLVCVGVCVWSKVRGSGGLNFINVLRPAFMLTEPKSVKKTVKSSVFLRFQYLRSLKLSVNMLAKLTHGICLFVSVSLYLSWFLCVNVYACITMFMWMFIYVCACVCVCVYLCVCICMCCRQRYYLLRNNS